MQKFVKLSVRMCKMVKDFNLAFQHQALYFFVSDGSRHNDKSHIVYVDDLSQPNIFLGQTKLELSENLTIALL